MDSSAFASGDRLALSLVWQRIMQTMNLAFSLCLSGPAHCANNDTVTILGAWLTHNTARLREEITVSPSQ